MAWHQPIAHRVGPAALCTLSSGTPNPKPGRSADLASQLAVACLGAGVVTSLAVASGQNPSTALGITLFSAVAAVMMGQVL